MKFDSLSFRFVFICVLLLSAVSISNAQEEWTWKDRDGEVRTRAELDEILENHRIWKAGEMEGTDAGIRADLTGADLSGADLRNADLRGADLTGAIMSRAYLNDADLRGANLSEANLREADLTGAVLSSAILNGAELSSAILNGANLGGAFLSAVNLKGADLRAADLRKAGLLKADLRGADLRASNLRFVNLRIADLTDADLSGADLRNVNLGESVYEPSQQPPAHLIYRARNLDEMRIESNPKALSDLRTSLQASGYRWAERDVIAALRRNDNPSKLETIFFDWTSEFGANPLRPLLIAAGIFLFCTPIYWVSLHRKGRSGLYLLASGKKVNTGKERVRVLRLRYHRPPKYPWYPYIFRKARREGHALGTAILFSLMSSFNIGFRELNFGRWIRMLQPREFDIKARGFARILSGMQSLLSVGAVALSLLSYFGTPFAP